jgi:hypothetical protein
MRWLFQFQFCLFFFSFFPSLLPSYTESGLQHQLFQLCWLCSLIRSLCPLSLSDKSSFTPLHLNRLRVLAFIKYPVGFSLPRRPIPLAWWVFFGVLFISLVRYRIIQRLSDIAVRDIQSFQQAQLGRPFRSHNYCCSALTL